MRVTASRQNSRTSSACREAIDTMFSEGVDGAFREAVIYQDYGLIVTNAHEQDLPLPSAAGISSRHRRYQQRSARRRQRACTLILMRLKILRDLSWLSQLTRNAFAGCLVYRENAYKNL